jgi:hypothetical protein
MMVDGLSGILKKPMIPAVIISGMRLGIMVAKYMEKDLNNRIISSVINITVNKRPSQRFSTRYLVPSATKTAIPVK